MKFLISTLVVNWLRLAAQLQLMKVHPIIIGVTGSSGKSTCVQAIGSVLSEHSNVKIGKKGNSETGIPMEILGIEVGTYNGFEWIHVCFLALLNLFTNWERYEILVLEMGIDSDKSPKNMSHLLSIVKPQIGVLLSITGVHGQNFSGSDILQSIANEKGLLLTELDQKETAIYSLDYPQISKLIPNIKAKQLNFSVDKTHGDLHLIKHELNLEGTTFTFIHQTKEYSLHFAKQLHFKESFGTFATAILIGLEFNISIKDACALLTKHFQQPPSRMSIIEGINESTIVDSSYNSSLGPTSAALRMMDELPGRKIAVLGDMRELGKKAQHDHEELAIHAAKSADIIVLVGPLTTQFVVPKLKVLQFNEANLFHFTNAYQAVGLLQKMIQPKDIVFVKGSQNTIFLEIIVKALMKHPDQAEKLLARQTPYWENQRILLK